MSKDPIGALVRVVEEIVQAFDARGEYSLPDDATPWSGDPALGQRLEEAYRALPAYRQGDAIECPQCRRHRMQMNGICEKCGWDLAWGDPSSEQRADTPDDPPSNQEEHR